MPLTRIQRLDRLPYTAQHNRVLFASGAGWALDALDVGLISFVIAQLAKLWDLSSWQTSWIATAGFIGMALGAAVGGMLADRFGRRHVFSVTLLLFGLATGASALAWGVGALILFRFFVGLGLGAELPVASTLVSEFAPTRFRGRIIVLLEAFWAVGWTVSAIIGYFVVPAGEAGWRWAFAVGALPALYAAVVRFGLPESVRFLEGRGRIEEAERVVVGFEGSPALFGTTTVEPESETEVAASGTVRRTRLVDLFSEGHARQTGALWAVWFFVNFSYYGAFLWIPTILVARGFTITKSFEYTLVLTLAQLPGYLVAAWLIERWGRRATLATFLAGSMVAAILFANAGTPALIMIFGSIMSFFNLGAWGALYAVTPELYPTHLRGTGAGWAAGIGRVASIIAPLIVPLLLASLGQSGLFLLFSAAFALAALASLLLREMRGKPLDE